MKPPRKYAVDTQLFIRAFRDAAARESLERFHYGFAPFEYFSVIVGQELRAGVKGKRDLEALEKRVLGVYERAGRVFTPSADAWHRSGDLMASMARRDGLELSKVSQSFSNDVLLALSCRESGCVLITENVGDFRRIRRHMEFEFIPPWPGLR